MKQTLNGGVPRRRCRLHIASERKAHGSESFLLLAFGNKAKAAAPLSILGPLIIKSQKGELKEPGWQLPSRS